MRAACDGWHDAQRLLCVRLDGMGDVLMMTPAMRAIRQSVEGRTITLLTSPGAAPIAPLIPEIDDVIVHAAPWTKEGAAEASPAADRRMIDALRGRFDAAVVFTTSTQSALPAAMLCRLAGIPLRLAYARENPYALLTHHLREDAPASSQAWRGSPVLANDARRDSSPSTVHEVQRQLNLVASVNPPAAIARRREIPPPLSLDVPADARQRAGELLAARGINATTTWALVHPGATAPSRRYPPAMFAAAADHLAGDGITIVFTGSPADGAIVDEARRHMRAPSISLAGATDVATLAALIAEAPIVITNNTAPSHMAAALGTPVVVLYALTNPQHTPWAPTERCRVLYRDVPCRNCLASVCRESHHGCLTLVDPASVAHAARELLAGRIVERTAAAC